MDEYNKRTFLLHCNMPLNHALGAECFQGTDAAHA
jgi:hypothetical protein